MDKLATLPKYIDSWDGKNRSTQKTLKAQEKSTSRTPTNMNVTASSA